MFFRAQDDLTNDLQKKLILRLGELAGRPKTSSLHIHPLLNSAPGLGGDDPEISTIDSQATTRYFRNRSAQQEPISSRQINLKKQNNSQWHSDISFEPVPADFTSLRLINLPETGGGKCIEKENPSPQISVHHKAVIVVDIYIYIYLYIRLHGFC